MNATQHKDKFVARSFMNRARQHFGYANKWLRQCADTSLLVDRGEIGQVWLSSDAENYATQIRLAHDALRYWSKNCIERVLAQEAGLVEEEKL